MSNHIIGFTGPATSGKDTAAQALIDTGMWKRVSFADPLKQSALVLNPLVTIPCDHELVRTQWPEATISGDDVMLRLAEVVEELGWDGAKRVPEVRRILQVMGTECGRQIFGPNCWVNIAAKSIQDVRNSGLRVVMTDVRFPEEAELIHNLGGTVVKIIRPGVGSLNAHPSEAGITCYDHVVYNNSSIDELHRKIIGSFATDVLIGDELAQAMGFYGDCRSD